MPGSETGAASFPSDLSNPALTAPSPPPSLPAGLPSAAPASSFPEVAAAAPAAGDAAEAPPLDGSAAPVLPGAAPATALARGPAGPSKETVALLGVICAAILIRYLSYSTKLRRL
jgi:hypothetical protein